MRYQSAADRMRWAVACLGLIILLEVLTIGLNVQLLGLVDAAQTNTPPAEEALIAFDSRATTLSLAYLGVYILTAVMFLRWLHLAVANLTPLHAEPLYSPGWAVGYWFIPFLNLVRPYQIVKNAWIGSADADSAEPEDAGLVGLWWGLWIFKLVLSRVSASNVNSAQGPSDLQTAVHIAIAACVVSITTALVAIKIARELTARQDLRIKRHPTADVFD